MERTTKPRFNVRPRTTQECRSCASYGHASGTCWQRPLGEARSPTSSCDRWLLNNHWRTSAGLR